MKMLIGHDGGCAVVRLAGRLDGESAGALVLNRVHQEFSSFRGELKVGPASDTALEAAVPQRAPVARVSAAA
jgi:hypothetical protein